MSVAIGVLIGLGLAVGVRLIWVAARSDRSEGRPAAHARQSALHAATTTLPHLRRGLTEQSAAAALPHLRALTGAAAIALADTGAVLAIEGEGREQVRPGDLITPLLGRTEDDRMHVVGRLISSDPACPLHAAALAPLIVSQRRVGTLITFYRAEGRPSADELRTLAEAASLVCAQVELSVLAEQEELLAQAELRALRAQISPHFIYNALAAVAGNIHEQPEQAREQLIDFAEFTRYLFRDARSYVTLGEEIDHVERYLRLEQARFPGALEVTIDVPPPTRGAIVPTMSVQPLVENAVRHGVDQHGGHGQLVLRARVVKGDVQLTVSDDGAGIAPDRIDAVLAGAGGGIGVPNVDARLRATFGDSYALRIQSIPGEGTTAILTVPNLRSLPAKTPLSPRRRIVRRPVISGRRR